MVSVFQCRCSKSNSKEINVNGGKSKKKFTWICTLLRVLTLYLKDLKLSLARHVSNNFFIYKLNSNNSQKYTILWEWYQKNLKSITSFGRNYTTIKKASKVEELTIQQDVSLILIYLQATEDEARRGLLGGDMGVTDVLLNVRFQSRNYGRILFSLQWSWIGQFHCICCTYASHVFIIRIS